MLHRVSTVGVARLPEVIDASYGRIFLSEFEKCADTNRPRIVLDCSQLCRMDGPAIHLLLCCLEEAMKRNGDVKLAAVDENAKMALQHIGADSLFEVFDTSTDAVNSFYRSPIEQTEAANNSEQIPEYAATMASEKGVQARGGGRDESFTGRTKTNDRWQPVDMPVGSADRGSRSATTGAILGPAAVNRTLNAEPAVGS